MHDVTMEASRGRCSICWWFWTYFVVNTCNMTLFSHVIIGIDHGRSGVTATTLSWFVVRRGRPNKSLGCCCGNSLPTIINPLITSWQFCIITSLCRISLKWNVAMVKILLTSGFPSQRAKNAEIISLSLCHLWLKLRLPWYVQPLECYSRGIF